jgi:pilus assembly protein CpaF
MRPDRIVIGEVRGEALDMLQAMNTAMTGPSPRSCEHAPRRAGRIENMVSMTGISFPPGVRAQIASAIDILIQVERQEDGGGAS